MTSSVQNHIQSIRATLRQVEEGVDLLADNPDLVELRRILQDRIDLLERVEPESQAAD